jgi:anti-anti-sigma regulatory factor
MQAQAAKNGCADLVVDLNGVGFAGSAALGGFVAIQRDCRARGGRVVFCGVDPTVREVFRVTNLEVLFQFATDVPAALAALRTASSMESDPSGAAAPSPPKATPPPPARGPLQGRRRSP